MDETAMGVMAREKKTWRERKKQKNKARSADQALFSFSRPGRAKLRYFLKRQQGVAKSVQRGFLPRLGLQRMARLACIAEKGASLFRWISVELRVAAPFLECKKSLAT